MMMRMNEALTMDVGTAAETGSDAALPRVNDEGLITDFGRQQLISLCSVTSSARSVV